MRKDAKEHGHLGTASSWSSQREEVRAQGSGDERVRRKLEISLRSQIQAQQFGLNPIDQCFPKCVLRQCEFSGELTSA